MTAAPPFALPLGFHEWTPVVQAATLGLLTFVQEDVPTVGAALLSAAGHLHWQTGLVGVFLGIWIGDALLYWLARGVGRPLLQHAWARRCLDPAAVARSEQWFAQRGTWILLSSRFIPGTRLPTYLAAGFLRLPFGRFLLVTGTAVAVWTVGIFFLAHTVGPDLLSWLEQLGSQRVAIVAVALALLLAIRVAMKLAQRDGRRRLRSTLHRWMHWEFWPAWLFYLPVVLNYLRLAIRHRGFTVPTAANPGIFSGGFVGESKMATLRDLQRTCPEFTADAYLLAGTNAADRLASLDQLCSEHTLSLPFILKPDMGQRGAGVKLIRTREQAMECLQRTSAPFIVQRYAPGPEEVGVFYYRIPGERQGHILAITEKLFPCVTGDGRLTVEELIWRDERARLIADTYLKKLGPRRSEILAPGQSLKLVEAGNHAQGCIFRTGAHLWSEPLERRIDTISQSIDGFFIGRYDIRYASAEDLRAGRNFSIIELNGASSEATVIYDARNSLSSVYRTLFRQWDLVFCIGAANRRLGTPPTDLATLWHKWRENAARVATYPVAD